MEAKWLEDFLSLARTGNFSQSAAERNITQSAFSRRIKSLEQWVGVSLIDRSTYPTRLTSAGQHFHEAAKKATSSLLKIRRELRQAQNTDRHLLRIAVQHSLAGSFLANWLATLALEKEDTLVLVKADNLHDCIRDLEEANVDMLVCYAHTDLPIGLNEERYFSQLMAEDTLCAVSSPGKAGKPRYGLDPAPSQEIPWLSYSAEAFLGRAATLALERGAGPLPLHVVYESALAEALRAAALAGMGLAWLPLSLVEEDLARGALVRASSEDYDVSLQVRLFVDRSTDNPRLLSLIS
ncbi:MAG: LysR family transcriptional regulator [Hylemonella sp.]